MSSDAHKATYGCGDIKEDLEYHTCWRKNLCKDCLGLRSKLKKEKVKA